MSVEKIIADHLKVDISEVTDDNMSLTTWVVIHYIL